MGGCTTKPATDPVVETTLDPKVIATPIKKLAAYPSLIAHRKAMNHPPATATDNDSQPTVLQPPPKQVILAMQSAAINHTDTKHIDPAATNDNTDDNREGNRDNILGADDANEEDDASSEDEKQAGDSGDNGDAGEKDEMVDELADEFVTGLLIVPREDDTVSEFLKRESAWIPDSPVDPFELITKNDLFIAGQSIAFGGKTDAKLPSGMVVVQNVDLKSLFLEKLQDAPISCVYIGEDVKREPLQAILVAVSALLQTGSIIMFENLIDDNATQTEVLLDYLRTSQIYNVRFEWVVKLHNLVALRCLSPI
jgi:hypothetical protein